MPLWAARPLVARLDAYVINPDPEWTLAIDLSEPETDSLSNPRGEIELHRGRLQTGWITFHCSVAYPT